MNTTTAQADFGLGLLDLNFANAAPVRIDAGSSITGGTASKASLLAPIPLMDGTAYTLLAGADQGATLGVSNAGTITTNQLAVVAGAAYNSAGKGAQSILYARTCG